MFEPEISLGIRDFQPLDLESERFCAKIAHFASTHRLGSSLF